MEQTEQVLSIENKLQFSKLKVILVSFAGSLTVKVIF